MTRTTAITTALMVTAVTVIAALGVLAGISPDFKARATLAAVIALTGLVLTGSVFAIVGRFLRYYIGPDTGPLRASHDYTTTAPAVPTRALR